MILENPDDDAPRLVYADWLEEQGDPLAEFIRLQCELPITEESQRDLTGELVVRPHYPDQREQDFIRQSQCLDVYAEEWLQPLPGPWVWPEGDLITVRMSQQNETLVEFRRGFVESAMLGIEEAQKYLVPLLQTQPVATIQILLELSRHAPVVLLGGRAISAPWEGGEQPALIPSLLVQIEKSTGTAAESSWRVHGEFSFAGPSGQPRTWEMEYQTRDDLVGSLPGDVWQALRNVTK
jgi:uncharacterized protein (TIGR02996 family)